MPNKTRLKEQRSSEPIDALNNKYIKIRYIYIYILNSTINELQSVVQSSSFDK